MKKFEYKEVIYDHTTDVDIIVLLNEWGEQGWELVQIVTGTNSVFILKREKNQTFHMGCPWCGGKIDVSSTTDL
jgi:hypothetical protein